MRALFSSLRTQAPFLFSERGALTLTRDLARAGKGGPSALASGQDNRGVGAEGTSATGLDLAGRTLVDCALANARLSGSTLTGGRVRRTHLRRGELRETRAADSEWSVVDLERGAVVDLAAPRSRWSLTSFRDAGLTEVDWTGASLVVCDFTRAELRDVRFDDAVLTGVDFQDAVLDRVSFRGADLGGCLMNGAWLGDVDFDGAIVGGLDLRDAAGLDPEALADLAERGARVGGGRLRRFWTRALGGSEPGAAQPRVRAAMGTTWALLALLLPALFFARAILHPVNPDAPPGFEEPEEEAPVEPPDENAEAPEE